MLVTLATSLAVNNVPVAFESAPSAIKSVVGLPVSLMMYCTPGIISAASMILSPALS